jgi:CheY-like chemotaxis protein
MMNLCTNAIHAMRGAGTLRIALEAVDAAAERTLTHGTLAPGRYVRLTVADSGGGMDAATLARIFEPFFTTKQVGRGTGLGLSLVYGIVTDSGGAIDVASEIGRGSTFEIYLPRAVAPAVVAEAADEPVPRGTGERVMLVDDEEPLTVMTAEVLTQLGYEAAPFTDGRAALEALEEAPETFQVVVTDEVMPVLTGTELARRIRRVRPDLPVLLLSGYSGPILTQQALGAGVNELLRKPVHSRELAAALARALRRTV